MPLIWNAKNNFILSHFVSLHQEQSSALNVDWTAIVNDVNIEISSTPMLLKNQYERLLETFSPDQDSKSLYRTLKQMYLQLLCRKIEDDSRFTLESIYELIRHIRAERIQIDDIVQLRKAWNFNYSSDDEKQNKERLSHLLNRLCDYMNSLSIDKYRPMAHLSTKYINAMQDEELEAISDDDEDQEISNGLLSNTNEHERAALIRRRSQSLTSMDGDNIVIGAQWFAPKLKGKPRSLLLHNQTSTTADHDELSNSTENSNLRQTRTQPSISWLPLTNGQVLEKQRQQTELKFMDGQLLDQVSSDSDSIQIQWPQSSDTQINNVSQVSSRRRTISSTASHDPSEQEDHLCKRQKLA